MVCDSEPMTLIPLCPAVWKNSVFEPRNREKVYFCFLWLLKRTADIIFSVIPYLSSCPGGSFDLCYLYDKCFERFI